MDREKRLQKLARLIYREYRAQEPIKGYATGGTLALHSVQIENITGITVDEQADALNVLSDEYRCINYTAVKDYSNENELTPQDILNIEEIASMGGHSSDDIKRTVLEQVTYMIEVLNTITDAINILGGKLCELTIENGVTPVVTIKGTRYRLQSLQAGSVSQRIVEYASKGCYDTELNNEDFKIIDVAQLNKANYNVAQVFRNNIFGKGGALSDFVTITPKTFLIRKNVLLDEDTISAIQKLAQN